MKNESYISLKPYQFYDINYMKCFLNTNMKIKDLIFRLVKLEVPGEKRYIKEFTLEKEDVYKRRNNLNEIKNRTIRKRFPIKSTGTYRLEVYNLNYTQLDFVKIELVPKIELINLFNTYRQSEKVEVNVKSTKNVFYNLVSDDYDKIKTVQFQSKVVVKDLNTINFIIDKKRISIDKFGQQLLLDIQSSINIFGYKLVKVKDEEIVASYTYLDYDELDQAGILIYGAPSETVEIKVNGKTELIVDLDFKGRYFIEGKRLKPFIQKEENNIKLIKKRKTYDEFQFKIYYHPIIRSIDENNEKINIHFEGSVESDIYLKIEANKDISNIKIDCEKEKSPFTLVADQIGEEFIIKPYYKIDDRIIYSSLEYKYEKENPNVNKGNIIFTLPKRILNKGIAI